MKTAVRKRTHRTIRNGEIVKRSVCYKVLVIWDDGTEQLLNVPFPTKEQAETEAAEFIKDFE